MRICAVLPALALAACSGGAGQDQQANGAEGQAQPAASSPVRAAVSAPAAGTGALRAQVSALSASVSGLERRVTDNAIILALSTDTLFAFDRADLGPDATANLQKAADEIRAGAPGDIVITGYTDSKGSDAYNAALSERRAQAVADWMKQQVGVRLRPFTVAGKGETDPVAPNTRPDGGDSPEGRARNRRVEIAIPRAG